MRLVSLKIKKKRKRKKNIRRSEGNGKVYNLLCLRFFYFISPRRINSGMSHLKFLFIFYFIYFFLTKTFRHELILKAF